MAVERIDVDGDQTNTMLDIPAVLGRFEIVPRMVPTLWTPLIARGGCDAEALYEARC